MPKTKTKQFVIQTGKISKEHDLCERCFYRLFSEKLRKKQSKKTTKCYICKNVFSNLEFYVKKMLEISSNYEFSSFVTGAILKPSYVDRDDFLRSKYKLRGIDSLKTELTRAISTKFHKKTKKKIDFQNPHVTFTINFKDNTCEIRSKPVFLFGRYTKTSRDFPQKQKPCDNCKGKGCVTCNKHGISDFNSVEGKISKFIFDKFGAQQLKITWIGGEDKTSLVSGRGRPIFLKLIDPKKRKTPKIKKASLDGISLSNLKKIDDLPKAPIPFKSKILIQITSEHDFDTKILKNIKSIKKTPILVNEKPRKETSKLVYELSYKKTSPNSFRLIITADGGLPIKKFVEGGSVNPSISEILGINCKCKEFDFHSVELQ